MFPKLCLFSYIVLSHIVSAQIDPNLIKQKDKDSNTTSLNMDATFNRPFLKFNKTPLSIGGYVEMNYQNLTTDGITDGDEFQFRKLSLFMASSISKKIKFLTEIEFEHDKNEEVEGKSMEISIEYAAIDIEIHSLLNIRGGIILNPIGSFNQNHDGPKMEFVDRPVAMTKMLPGTFSNSGVGLYGKMYKKNWLFGYECYFTGGFNGSIIDNDKGKTYLPQSNENTSRFVTSASGSPLASVKLSVRNNKFGELGLSWMSGIYNQYQSKGLTIDSKRNCQVFDIDFNTTITHLNTKILGEWAWVLVDLPLGYSPQFGSKQRGGYVDIVHPIFRGNIFGWDKATINIALRGEYTDWNVGTFASSGLNIYDEMWGISPAISLRPTPLTVFRLNYKIEKNISFTNISNYTTGILIGISSYF